MLIALCFLAVTVVAESKRVHVFVALADNEHQGIAKVPPKIGKRMLKGQSTLSGMRQRCRAEACHTHSTTLPRDKIA